MDPLFSVVDFSLAALLLVGGPRVLARLASVGLFLVASGTAYVGLQKSLDGVAATSFEVVLVVSALAGLLASSLVRFPLAARWGGVAAGWLLIVLIRHQLLGFWPEGAVNAVVFLLATASMLSGFAMLGSLAGMLLIVALSLPLEVDWEIPSVLAGCWLVAWFRFGRLAATRVDVKLQSVGALADQFRDTVSMALGFEGTLDRVLFEREARRRGHHMETLAGLNVVLVELPVWKAAAMQRLNHFTGLFHAGWPCTADLAVAPVSVPAPPVMTASSGTIDLAEIRTRLRTDANGLALPGHRYNGAGARVGILDTGVEDRPEYADRMVERISFVPGESVQDICTCRHGSNCGMIVNAIAPEAELHFLKVLGGPGGSGQLDWILKAYNHVIQKGIDVINCSYGSCSCAGASTCLSCRAVESLRSKGVLVCASAGNSGPRPRSIGCPGGSRGALSVAAATPGRNIADFSSRGPSADPTNGKPEVAAYGSGVLLRTSAYGANLVPMNGTSFSCPQVAGLGAILVSRAKGLRGGTQNAERIRSIILESSSTTGMGTGSRDPHATGRGMINVAAAVAILNGQRPPLPGASFAGRWLFRPLTIPAAGAAALAMAWIGSNHLADVEGLDRAVDVRLLGRVHHGSRGLWMDDGTSAAPLVWDQPHSIPTDGSLVWLTGTRDPETGAVLGRSRVQWGHPRQN